MLFLNVFVSEHFPSLPFFFASRNHLYKESPWCEYQAVVTFTDDATDVKLLIINVMVVITLFDHVDSLQSMGPNSLMFVRNLLDKLGSNQQNILKFIACNEIFLMPATVFMLFRYSFFFACLLWGLNHRQLNSSWFPFLQLGCEQYFSFIRSIAFITIIVNVFWFGPFRLTIKIECATLYSFYCMGNSTLFFFSQWPRKLAAAFHLLQIPDPALHIQKKSLLPVNVKL